MKVRIGTLAALIVNVWVAGASIAANGFPRPELNPKPWLAAVDWDFSNSRVLQIDVKQAKNLLTRNNREKTPLKERLDQIKSAGLSSAELNEVLTFGLGEAIQKNDAAEVRAMIDAGANLGSSGDRLAPHWAGVKDDAIFDLLFDQAVKENYFSRMFSQELTVGELALIHACGTGNKKRVDRILAAGVIPSKSTDIGTALSASAAAGSVELVNLFLDLGIDVNATDKYGATAFLRAVNKNWKPEVLALLASKGARVDICDTSSDDPTVVATAVVTRDLGLLKEVLRLGAPLMIKRRGLPPFDALANAIQARDIQGVKMLLDAGVKPGACKGVKGGMVTHLEVARQTTEFGDIDAAKEILKLIEEAGK